MNLAEKSWQEQQAVQVFNHSEFGEIRVIQMNNEPWFVGKDVAEKLGYKNTRDALIRHVESEDKDVVEILDSIGRKQNMVTVNESGLYSLILSSGLEGAKKFKRWVTSEVLPTIRRHGAYMTSETLEQAITSPDFLIKLATNLKEEKEKRELAEKELHEKNRFISQISASSNTILVRDLAHLVTKKGFAIGEKRLWNKLREWGLVSKKGTKPMQRYLEQGLFEVNEFAIQSNSGVIVKSTTRVTGKGQKYIIEKLLEEMN